MCALDGSTAYIQRRTDDLVHTQCLGTYGRANDINDGVHGAYLVEMDGINGHIVNLGFRRAQSFKYPNGGCLCRL